MPQDGPKLSQAVVADFTHWIKKGAFDPRDQPPSTETIEKLTSWASTRERRKKWWSFQPIADQAPPSVGNSDWSDHLVDQFVLYKLEEANLQPTQAADRRALIRRVTFALIGLPPTVAEVEAFVADNSEDAYKQLIDRLLASPQFGERWARHWMDWFRYADSHGSEGDPRIPNAWQYRDYLIRALNEDVPYDQLVREHIAGDLLENPRLNDELGLNESAIGIGHFRLMEHGYAPTDALEELVRTTDNQIDVLTKAFLGLTVSCARCHDHKFDPISQADYYALYGIMASCRPAQINVDTRERQELHKRELSSLKQLIRQSIAELWLDRLDEITNRFSELPKPSPAAELNDKKKFAGWSPAQKRVNEAVAQGLLNPLYPWLRVRGTGQSEIRETWQMMVEEFQQSQLRLQKRGEQTYDYHWRAADAASEHWHRLGNGLDSGSSPAGEFRIDVEGNKVVANIYPAGAYTHLLSSKHSGHLSSKSFPLTVKSIWVRANGSRGRTRYVMSNYPRVSGPIYGQHALDSEVSKWLHWDVTYWLGDLTHLEFAASRDLPVEAGTPVRSWFGVSEVVAVHEDQTPPQNEAAEFLLPLFVKAGENLLGSPTQLLDWYRRALRDCTEAWQSERMSDEQARFLSYFVRNDFLPNELDVSTELRELVAEYRKLEAQVLAPTRVPGVFDAEVGDRPLLVRGNHKQPSELVPRRFLEALGARPFEPTGSGRLELAEAFLSPDNPLTSRVMVNRIWHYLFGRGIVGTPDNFGRLGELPTHPELLDYLARRFVEDEYSIKKMVRLLVTSKTFQLASGEPSIEVDPENHLLSHMRVRRLEAEPLRDAILQMSGQLDTKMFGLSVEGKNPRRSVYVQVIRNELNPFLQAFDAPAPFSTKGQRNVTNVPAQALMLMNSEFVRGCAEKWGERIAQDSTLPDDRARINRLYFEAYARRATEREQTAADVYLKRLRNIVEAENFDVAIWQEFAHALIGSKEFAYIR